MNEYSQYLISYIIIGFTKDIFHASTGNAKIGFKACPIVKTYI